EIAEQIDIALQLDNSQPFKYHYILETLELPLLCRDKKTIQAAIKKWCQKPHYSNALKLFNVEHQQEFINKLDPKEYGLHQQLCETFKLDLYAGKKAINKCIVNYRFKNNARDQNKSALLKELNMQLEIAKE